MIRQIHHVAILTSDIETAIQHYVKVMGCQAKEPTTVERPGVRWRTVLLPIGNGSTSLQLIEPHEGPGVRELQDGGEGTLFEIGLQCESIEAFHDHLDHLSIEPGDLRGQPLDSRYLESKFGNCYFIIPKDQSRGTRLEIVQIGRL